MKIEAGRQLSFIHLTPLPQEIEFHRPFAERTLSDVLTDDFPATIQKIRCVYLPKGSLLLENDHLLEEAISTSSKIKSLFDEGVKSHPAMNLALASNLETLRKREIFLENTKSKPSLHPKIAHKIDTPSWEDEIRLATDRQFFKLKSTPPEDKGNPEGKLKPPFTGSTSEALWVMSTLFYPNPNADLAVRISGEDWLTSELFSYYISYLINKERLAIAFQKTRKKK